MGHPRREGALRGACSDTDETPDQMRCLPPRKLRAAPASAETTEVPSRRMILVRKNAHRDPSRRAARGTSRKEYPGGRVRFSPPRFRTRCAQRYSWLVRSTGHHLPRYHLRCKKAKAAMRPTALSASAATYTRFEHRSDPSNVHARPRTSNNATAAQASGARPRGDSRTSLRFDSAFIVAEMMSLPQTMRKRQSSRHVERIGADKRVGSRIDSAIVVEDPGILKKNADYPFLQQVLELLGMLIWSPTSWSLWKDCP